MPLIYNAVFAYAAKTVQELHEVVKQTTTTDRILLIKQVVSWILINWVITYFDSPSYLVLLLILKFWKNAFIFESGCKA